MKSTYTCTSGYTLLDRHRARETLDSDGFRTEAEACLNESRGNTWDLRLTLVDESYRPRKDWAATARHLHALVQQAASDQGNAHRDELPGVYASLASTLEQLGEKRQAMEWHGRLLAEFPDHPAAKRSRMVLDQYSR